LDMVAVTLLGAALPPPAHVPVGAVATLPVPAPAPGLGPLGAA